MGNKHCGSCGRPSFVNNRCAGCEIQHRLDTELRNEDLREFPAIVAGRLMETSLEGNTRLLEVIATCSRYLGLEVSPPLVNVDAAICHYAHNNGWGRSEESYDPEFEENAAAWALHQSWAPEIRDNRGFQMLMFWLSSLWYTVAELEEEVFIEDGLVAYDRVELSSEYLYDDELDGLRRLRQARVNLLGWFAEFEPQPPEDDGGGHDDCPPNCMKCNPTFGMTHGSVTKVARSELRRMEREDQFPYGELTREYKARRRRNPKLHGFGHSG